MTRPHAPTRSLPLPLLVTMGDPCGIGPEIVVQAACAGALDDALVIGSVAVLRRATQGLGVELPVALIDAPEDRAQLPRGALAVCEPARLPSGLAELPLGRIDARAGLAAARCIEQAAAWMRAGRGRAIVTAPLHKKAFAAAGIVHPGHTEMLQALATEDGVTPPVRMMLANGELSVVLVTIHLALRQAIEALSTEGIVQTVKIASEAMMRAGIAAPRIAVAGLNPHAGEDGLFGDEEVRLIAPAIAQARALGIDATGPHAPDTVFMRARHAPPEHPGEFDCVVAMTHDHGLIPVKYLGVEHGVNVTLGLPFVRTSPDHGTAFDIAGTGVADPSSLCAALDMARRLAPPAAG